MGLKNIFCLILIGGFLISMSSCDFTKTAKSDIEIDFTQDTLEVGYTYWWPESGPFIGYCGEQYALVFIGTVKNIQPPTEEASPLYISQKGVIELEKVFAIENQDEAVYVNQGFFVSDCFDQLDIKQGDRVLVFCYAYEGRFSIPGGRSILKINSLDHPLVKATKSFIDTGQNPLKIKKDTTLWSAYGFGGQLRQHIRCHENSE